MGKIMIIFMINGNILNGKPWRFPKRKEGREIIPGGLGEQDSKEKQEEEKQEEEQLLPPPPPQIPVVKGKDVDSVELDEGTEVDLVLGPPPTYPTFGTPMNDVDLDRPPIN